MKNAPFLVAAVLITGCLPIQRPERIGGNDPRIRALDGVRPGTPIRLATTDLGPVEGIYQGRREGQLVVSRDMDVLTIDVSAIETLQLYHEASLAGVAGGAIGAMLLPVIIEQLKPYGRRRVVEPQFGGILFLAGAGLGLAIGGVSSGWVQAWPDRLHPASWLHSAPASSGVLRAEVRLSNVVAAHGDSVVATIAITNTSADTVELLERTCGPLLVIVAPGRAEWAAPPCGPGLQATRLAPGTLTRRMSFAADLPNGIYRVEARVLRLAPDRGYPLDAGRVLRLTARSGLLVQ